MAGQFNYKIDFNDRKKLPLKMGIYGIYNIKNELLYIGAAFNLRRRLTNHNKMLEFAQNQASIIKYIIIDDIETLYEKEHSYIINLKPSLNVMRSRSRTIRPIKDKELPTINEIRNQSYRSGSILQKIIFELAWEYVLSSESRLLAIDTIVKSTGLSPFWLRNFLDIPDNKASCERIEKLYNYLTGSNLLELIESNEYKEIRDRLTSPINKNNLNIQSFK